MARTTEEIEEEMKQLDIKRKEAEKEYNRVLKSGFKKHEECCPDICTVINEAISKLTKNIKKANVIKEKTISPKLERSLSKDIIIAESQINELKKIKEELYAKSICNCK